MGGGELNGYFWNAMTASWHPELSSRISMTMQSATDDLAQTFITEWCNMHADSVSVTAGITFPLAVPIGLIAYSCAGLMCNAGPRSERKKTMGDLQYGY